MDKITFKCTKCGSCCNKISDENSPSRGLPLFEWEVEGIQRLAKEKSIKIKIKPLDSVFDKKSGLHFCTGYLLVDEPCAFLKDNKCQIYKERPIICRAFPLAKNPLFLEDVPDLSCFSKCCNLNAEKFLASLGLQKGKPYNLSKKLIIEEYSKTFDKEIMNASFIRDKIFNYFDSLMKTLSKKGLIDLEIVKIKENTAPIPFLQFLVERGFINKEDKASLIKELTSEIT